MVLCKYVLEGGSIGSDWIRDCPEIVGENDFKGLVQDCSNSSAYRLELLQSCTKPLICNAF